MKWVQGGGQPEVEIEVPMLWLLMKIEKNKHLIYNLATVTSCK